MMFTPQQGEIRQRYAGIGSEIAAGAAARAEGFDFDGWLRLRDAGLWRMIVPGSDHATGDWWSFTAALDGLSSTIGAPVSRMASSTFQGLRPPARK